MKHSTLLWLYGFGVLAIGIMEKSDSIVAAGLILGGLVSVVKPIENISTTLDSTNGERSE